MNSITTKIRDVAEAFGGLARIGAGLAADRVRAAAGVPRLRDCDACGGTDYTMRTVYGVRTCISCIEAERKEECEAHYGARREARRASDAWVTERAVLMRQRDEAQGRLAEAQGSIGEQMMETALVAGYRNAERARADKAEAERDDLVRQRDEAQQERIRETAKIQDVVKGFCDEFALVRRRMEDFKKNLAIARTEKADVSRLHDDTLTALSAAIQRAEKAERTITLQAADMKSFRAALIQIVHTVGGSAAPTVSNAFLCDVPKEVELVLAAEKRQAANAKGELVIALDRAEKAVEKYNRESLQWKTLRESFWQAARELRVATTDRNSFHRDIMRLAKALSQRVRADDHACGRCVPGGPMVREGFVCAYHLAEDYCAAERVRTADVEVAIATHEHCEACDGAGRYDDTANSDVPGPIWVNCHDCDGRGVSS